MSFNTIFQLAAMKRDKDPALRIAHRLLMMPDALTYLLSGAIGAEYTIATTTQAYDPVAHDWAWELVAALDLPRRVFPPVMPPGSVAGQLRDAICEELNCPPVPVIRTASHDTASAVAAVPASSARSWAYLSSGTWSLLGVELDGPLLSSAAMHANYTNEGGVGGKIRFLKNIMGLWLIQESRNTWMRQGQSYSFAELAQLAAAATPFRALVNPNDDRFIAPGDMPARIREFCRETGQTAPAAPGEVIRCALESLALRYRQTVSEIEEITGKPIEVIHLVGGGSQNELLNQFTANAINRPVITGPVEATAIGNIICQAMATGELPALDAARQVVRDSFDTTEYRPQDAEAWEDAYQRYRRLCRG
jgi:rhamnulokinase